jgi:hypothetical protein
MAPHLRNRVDSPATKPCPAHACIPPRHACWPQGITLASGLHWPCIRDAGRRQNWTPEIASDDARDASVWNNDGVVERRAGVEAIRATVAASRPGEAGQ